MRIRRIKCDEFLGLRNLDLNFPTGPGGVVLTGSNGSGKTSVLKLLNTAIARTGLGSEYESGLTREWISDRYDYEVELEFSVAELDGFAEFAAGEEYNPVPLEVVSSWDRTLVSSMRVDTANPFQTHTQQRSFGGVDAAWHEMMAQHLARYFDNRNQLKSVFIDANRAYPGDTNRHSYSVNYTELEDFHSKRNSASLKSLDAYNLMLDYLAYIEGRSLTRSRGKGRTEDADLGPPLVGYSDPLNEISAVVNRVMPHLQVLYVDTTERMLYLKRGDVEVPFSHLSGGEREVVFIAAQIMRMKVSDGVLLIDEPELHLNPELIRRLMESISLLTGQEQVILASHSYEVVESAGAERTILLEWEPGEDRTSSSVLANSPVLLTLANTLGRIGFSTFNQTLVMIEGGENSLRAVPRFETILAGLENFAVIKYGNTRNHVLDRHSRIAEFVALDEVTLSAVAIVDMDFDSLKNTGPIEDGQVYRTFGNEIENLFMEPEFLHRALTVIDSDITEEMVRQIIDQAIDNRSGRWVWGHMSYFNNADWKKESVRWKGLRLLQREVERMNWEEFSVSIPDIHQRLSGIIPDASEVLRTSVDAFQELRKREDRWRHSLGKELLKDVARRFDWSDDGHHLERLVVRTWFEDIDSAPSDIRDLRGFVAKQQSISTI